MKQLHAHNRWARTTAFVLAALLLLALLLMAGARQVSLPLTGIQSSRQFMPPDPEDWCRKVNLNKLNAELDKAEIYFVTVWANTWSTGAICVALYVTQACRSVAQKMRTGSNSSKVFMPDAGDEWYKTDRRHAPSHTIWSLAAPAVWPLFHQAGDRSAAQLPGPG
jgi:hypothetical protein